MRNLNSTVLLLITVIIVIFECIGDHSVISANIAHSVISIMMVLGVMASAICLYFLAARMCQVLQCSRSMKTFLCLGTGTTFLMGLHSIHVNFMLAGLLTFMVVSSYQNISSHKIDSKYFVDRLMKAL